MFRETVEADCEENGCIDDSDTSPFSSGRERGDSVDNDRVCA